ncbi:MAG: hypothetical protein KDA86_09910 [Planctomycetaceae bacterium]|nr:hypothetical protein [Planctomycetaceae bacterium]
MNSNIDTSASKITEVEGRVEHVILLLHGIRDMGGWQLRVKTQLEKHIPRSKCISIRYGWFGPLSFISPFDLGGAAYSNLHSQYQRAKKDHPHAKISIIAHSFGCHLTGRLLQMNPDAAFHRIILCGGVLSRQYDWRDVRDRYGVSVPDTDEAVINERGNSDPWPIIAEHFNGRYGASGAYGFERPHRLSERDYHGGHGVFFDRDHIEEYWVPFLNGRALGESTSIPREPSLLERILLSIPGLRLFVQISVAILWLFVWLWWLWLLAGITYIVTCYMLGWCADATPPICERKYQEIDYSLPADHPLVNPSDDPRFPDRSQVIGYTPRLPADAVGVQCVNESGFDLWVLLFDCSHFYTQGGSPTVSFPAAYGVTEEPVDGFLSESGWYGIYAFRSELGAPIWLGVANVRNARLTTIIIKCSGDTLSAEIRQ